MNKTSGKLAAGVRKVRTPAKAPAAVENIPAVQAAAGQAAATAEPKRSPASFRAVVADLHPDRIWPD